MAENDAVLTLKESVSNVKKINALEKIIVENGPLI